VDVVLACSEACANAVQHPENLTRQAFEVEARWDGDDLALSVRDFGRWSTDGMRDETHGRGLQMMRALMDAVDVTLADDGARILMRGKVARS
jgi:anti-sigma regulatory factor (Ser/Thr protein kinase)